MAGLVNFFEQDIKLAKVSPSKLAGLRPRPGEKTGKEKISRLSTLDS